MIFNLVRYKTSSRLKIMTTEWASNIEYILVDLNSMKLVIPHTFIIDIFVFIILNLVTFWTLIYFILPLQKLIVLGFLFHV